MRTLFICILPFIIILLSIGIVVYCCCNNRKNKQLETEKRIAAQEQENHTSPVKNILNNESIKHLDDRLQVLNKFIIADMTGNALGTAHDELKKFMEDQANFLESTKWSVALAHPRFIEHLENCEMDNYEICICCLYAIGLNGKSIKIYLNKTDNTFYKISGEIRKKLGLKDYQNNLNTHLLKLLHDLS